MKTLRSPETSGIINSTTQRKNSEDPNPQQKHICACASLNLIASVGENCLFILNHKPFMRLLAMSILIILNVVFYTSKNIINVRDLTKTYTTLVGLQQWQWIPQSNAKYCSENFCIFLRFCSSFVTQSRAGPQRTTQYKTTTNTCDLTS